MLSPAVDGDVEVFKGLGGVVKVGEGFDLEGHLGHVGDVLEVLDGLGLIAKGPKGSGGGVAGLSHHGTDGPTFLIYEVLPEDDEHGKTFHGGLYRSSSKLSRHDGKRGRKGRRIRGAGESWMEGMHMRGRGEEGKHL